MDMVIIMIVGVLAYYSIYSIREEVKSLKSELVVARTDINRLTEAALRNKQFEMSVPVPPNPLWTYSTHTG